MSKLSINKLFYWSSRNFGNELSLYLINKITQKSFILCQPPFNDNVLVAIGSIITPHVLHSKVTIWGTGTLHTRCLDLPRLKLFPLSRFFRNILDRLNISQPEIYAVRGPRTREMLLKIGLNCPEVYGDPAILLPHFYQVKHTKLDHKIGLILHHSQSLTPHQLSLCKNLGILPISILRQGNDEIEDFIEEVCSCDRIFSSSLHGVIIAQTYGIPAQWIRLKDLPIHSDDWHKFEDYFLGAGQMNQHALEIKLTNQYLEYLFEVKMPQIQPFDMSDSLLKAFPPRFLL